MDKTTKVAKTTWERASLKAISESTGIPVRHLKKAKAMFPECVTGNNTVNWLILQPLYEQHKEDIESSDDATIESVKLENLKKDGALKSIAIQKAKEELVEKVVVKALLTKIASAQDSLFNGKLRQELPSRAVALGIVTKENEYKLARLCDEVLASVYQVMQGGLETWK